MAGTPDESESMMRIALSVLLVAIVLTNARADEHDHPPQDVPIHEQFYSTWMRPDQPNQSCCNRRDCAPATAVRRHGDRWQAERNGEWLTIPPEKVERHRDSPDGRSHLCAIGLSVICFVFGAGT